MKRHKTIRAILTALAVMAIIACAKLEHKDTGPNVSTAWALLRGGDEAESMKEFLHLSDDYHRKGDFDNESISLFCAAQLFFEQRDTSGVKSILARMEMLSTAHPDMLNVTYSYHSVRQALYAILYEENGHEEDRDEMLSEGRISIGLMEKMSRAQMEECKVNPVWNYYNMAVGYDMYFDEPVRDSIAYYLEKAQEANKLDHLAPESLNLEGEISIRDEQSWLYYYDGEYEKAEAEMFSVLSLIDTVETLSPNTVLTEKGEAYAFLVELYTNTGRPEEALRYQNLKNENDLVRMSVERNQAVHKVREQYNVAKAEAKVARLKVMLILFGGIIILLALVTALLLLWRRNRIQMQYSAAVEALIETDSEVGNLTKDIPADIANKIFSAARKPLSAVERKYILLFMSGKSTDEIATAMHVAPASVYTMKYRIKKKFPDDHTLPF